MESISQMEIERQVGKGFKSEDAQYFFDFLKEMQVLFDQSTEENRILFQQSLEQLSAIGVRPSVALQKDIESVSPDSLFASLITLSSVKNQLVRQYPMSKVSKIQTLEQQARKNSVQKKTLEIIKNTADNTQQINRKTAQILTEIQTNAGRFKPEAIQKYQEFVQDMQLIQQKVQKVEFTLLNQFQTKQEQDFAQYEADLLQGQNKTKIEIDTRQGLIDQLQGEKLALDQRITELTREYEAQQRIVAELKTQGEQQGIEFERRILEITTKNKIALEENQMLLSQFRASESSEEVLQKEVDNLLAEVRKLTNELTTKNIEIQNSANQKLSLERKLEQNKTLIDQLNGRITELQSVNLESQRQNEIRLSEMKQQLSEFQEDLGSVRVELTQSQLKVNLTEEEKASQKEQLDSQIVELQDQIRQLEERIQTQDKISEANNESDRRRMQELQTLREERVQLVEEVAALETRLAQTIEESEGVQISAALKHQQEVEELTRKISEIKRRFEDQQELIKQYESRIADQGQEIEKLQQQETTLSELLSRERQQNQINITMMQQTEIRVRQLENAINLVQQILNEQDFFRRSLFIDELSSLNVLDMEQFLGNLQQQQGQDREIQTDPVLFYNESIQALEQQIETQNMLMSSLRQQVQTYQDNTNLYNTILADLQLLRQELQKDETELNTMILQGQLKYQTSDVQLLRNEIFNLRNRAIRSLRDDYQQTLENMRSELEAVNADRRFVQQEIQQFQTEMSEMSLSVDQSALNRQKEIQERLNEIELERIRFMEGKDPDAIKEILKTKILDLQKNNPAILNQISDVLKQQNRQNAQLRNISLNLLRNIKPTDLITYIDNLVPALLNLNPLNAQNIINQSYFFLFRKRPRQFISNEPSRLFEEQEIQDLKYQLSQSVVLERGKKLIYSNQEIGLSDDLRKKQFSRSFIVSQNPISNFDRNQDDDFDDLNLMRLMNSTEQIDNQNQFLRGSSKILNQGPQFDVLEEIKENSFQQQLFNFPPGGGDDGGGGKGPGNQFHMDRKKKIRQQRYLLSKTMNVGAGGGGDEPPDDDDFDESDDPEDGDSDYDYVDEGEEVEGEQIMVNEQGNTEILESFAEDENQREIDRIAQIDREITNLLVNLFNEDPGDGGGSGYNGGGGRNDGILFGELSSIGNQSTLILDQTSLLDLETALKVLIDIYKRDKKDKLKKAALPVLRAMLRSVLREKKSNSQKERAKFDDVRLISKAI